MKEEQFSHRVMLGEQGEIAIPTDSIDGVINVIVE